LFNKVAVKDSGQYEIQAMIEALLSVPLGMILTTVLFIYAGHGWYKLLSKVGEDRLSDVFGIANRLLPPSAIVNGPIACVPIPA
jgi:hypothetical protein